MWLLREKQSDVRVNKSYFELIALYLHPINSNHLRSHLWAIMAFGHSRLGLENCFLENKSGRIGCVRQVYFTKSCQQSGCVSNLLYFLYITSEVKQYYEALFLSYRPQTEYSISHFFKTNCTHSIFWTTDCARVLLGKLNGSNNFQNHLYGQPVLTFDQLRFNIIKNLLCLFFIQWYL